MSDTPRTDQLIETIENDLGDGPPCISQAAIDVAVRFKLIQHAKTIERELAAQEKVSDELEDAIKLLLKELDEAKSELAEAKREIEALSYKPEKCLQCGHYHFGPERCMIR